jgi:hypothetical protein
MTISRSAISKQVTDAPGSRKVVKKKNGGKICAKGKAWAKRTFDTYPSAYANMAASKYCKDPNYAKKSKKKKTQKKARGGLVRTF